MSRRLIYTTPRRCVLHRTKLDDGLTASLQITSKLKYIPVSFELLLRRTEQSRCQVTVTRLVLIWRVRSQFNSFYNVHQWKESANIRCKSRVINRREWKIFVTNCQVVAKEFIHEVSSMQCEFAIDVSYDIFNERSGVVTSLFRSHQNLPSLYPNLSDFLFVLVKEINGQIN